VKNEELLNIAVEIKGRIGAIITPALEGRLHIDSTTAANRNNIIGKFFVCVLRIK
jgi:hypothetical protein